MPNNEPHPPNDPLWCYEENRPIDPVDILPEVLQEWAERIMCGEPCPACGSKTDIPGTPRLKHDPLCNYARNVLDPL